MTKPSTYVWLSIGLYVLCLTQNAYHLSGGESPEAILEFLIGWLGPFYGIFAWYANPALLISWITLSKGKYIGALVFATIAIILSASFLLYDEVPVDEAPNYEAITGYGLGYWLWIMSEMVIVIGVFASTNKSSKKDSLTAVSS